MVTKKRKPTPAQLAARERFAEMARSGAFKKGAKRKKNPLVTETVRPEIEFDPVDEFVLKHIKKGMSAKEIIQLRRDARDMFMGGAEIPEGGLSGESERYISDKEFLKWVESLSRKTNPTKKTVSQKISQLTREGYPNRQAVAIALNEERAGKVRRNPIVKDAVSKLPSNFKYGVQTKATENWSLQAAFKTKAEAMDYAQAIAKNYPRLPIRVVTYTGGPIPA